MIYLGMAIGITAGVIAALLLIGAAIKYGAGRGLNL